MFYDLCLSDIQLELETQRERVAVAMSLGYDAVAISHQAMAKLSSADRCQIRLLKLEELEAASKSFRATPHHEGGSKPVPHGLVDKFQQFTRLNIPVDDTNTAQESSSQNNIWNSYDIVAAQPQSERGFTFACTSMPIDIITIDLTKRLSYRMKPDTIKTAIQRGICFEILCAPLLRETGTRRQQIANAQTMSQATRGKRILFGSGARSIADLRGPHDLMNLATFLGLSEKEARASITSTAKSVIDHARKRQKYRGTLSIRGFQEEVDDTLVAGKPAEKAQDIEME